MSLELLGGDVGNGVGGVLAGLKRQHVGEETGNVRRGHGGSGDGVDGVLAANPGGLNFETGGKDVIALAVVGEVSTLIGQGGGTDSDGVLSSGRRIAARVGVVITSSDGEVDASVDSSVDGLVKNGRLATTKRHVGGASLEALLALALLLRRHLFQVSLGSVLDTLDDIGHGAGAVGAEHLDSVNVCLLGNTVLLATDSAGAVSTVSVSILISIAGGDGLAPLGTTFKVDVVDVGAGVDDVDVNTLTALGGVEVLVEGAKGQAVPVGDTGKTPRGVLLEGGFLLGAHGVDFLVNLDIFDLWHLLAFDT